MRAGCPIEPALLRLTDMLGPGKVPSKAVRVSKRTQEAAIPNAVRFMVFPVVRSSTFMRLRR